MSTVLYQAAVDSKGNGIDAALCDGNGKLWRLPFDTPTEFANEYMAGKIVEHCHYLGVVEVHSTRDRAGVHYDMEDAKQRALHANDISIDACINDYVMNQMQDRVRMNLPPLPPQGRALESCIIRKFNLFKAGIRLIGWVPPYEMEDPGYGNTPIGSGQPAMVDERINQLQAQLMTMNQMLLELLQGKVAERVGKKGKMVKPEPEPDPGPAPEPASDSGDMTAATDSYEADQKQQNVSVRL